MSEIDQQGLPVTIITGFLGSGKTTLLNQILQNDLNQKVAVLVNEFGDINIDSQLLVSYDDDMVELSNGCICCTINEGLVEAVERILARKEKVERLIIETTGIADPLFDSKMISRDFGFAVGMNGAILRRGNIPTIVNSFPEDKLKVFPNPAQDYYIMKVISERSFDAQLSLLSVDGQIVNNKNITINLIIISAGFIYRKGMRFGGRTVLVVILF